MKEPTDTSDMDFTESDWEEAAAEARAAGHRVDKTEKGYEFYPFGEGGSGSTPRFLKEYPSGVGPAMIFPTDDPSGIDDLRRSAKMKRNPEENPRQRVRTSCASECIRSPGHEGDCRRYPDWCYESDANGGGLRDDISPDELRDARAAAVSTHKKHMQENPRDLCPSRDFGRCIAGPDGLCKFCGGRVMEKNPPSFKEGDRVVFNANPAARMLYREGMRLANGHEGTVTKMPVGGGRRAATMPGPRGGLVYVEWDDWGTIGVFAEDLQKQSPQPSEGGRPIYTSTYCNQGHYMDTGRPIGHECRIIPPAALRAERDGDFEKAIEIMNASPKVVVRGRAQKNPGFWNDPENAHSIDGVVIDEPDIVKRLFDWHSGQNDPVYAVASSSNAGRPVTRGLVDKAIANLSGLLRKVKGKDKRDLETLIDDLTPYGT